MFHASAITEHVKQRVMKHQQFLHHYLPYASESSYPPLHTTPLYHDLDLFVRIANGDLDRATVDEQQLGDIVERFQHLLDLLFLPTSGYYAYSVPPKFWTDTIIGQMLAYVQAWLRHDDLIGYTEAAYLLFPELALANLQAARMRVKRLVERNLLQGYNDPSARNPTQQVRVSRQATEALKASNQHLQSSRRSGRVA
jgi:hypothetical protein